MTIFGYCFDCPHLGGTASRLSCCQAENDAIVEVIAKSHFHDYGFADLRKNEKPRNRAERRRAARKERK